MPGMLHRFVKKIKPMLLTFSGTLTSGKCITFSGGNVFVRKTYFCRYHQKNNC